MTPVLLDTDIGTNIDDALALAYLLRQPRCELLGVTTVTGRPEQRAELAAALCEVLGRPNVPIHSGAGEPLAIAQTQLDVPQHPLVAGRPHRRSFPANTAVDFLREMIRSRPGEIVLLSIGPLTNVALLHRAGADVAALAGEHVMMGGLYTGPVPGYGPAERNVAGDPEAAAAVFAASVPVRCVGLEVTTRCELSTELCRSRFEAAGLTLLAELSRLRLEEGRREIRFHDPLAAAIVFEPGLCGYKRGRIAVEPTGQAVPGRTHFRPDVNGPHEVAVSVDPAAFFEHFFTTLGC